MRRLLLLVPIAAALALPACSHNKASGPAWPAPSKTEPEDDGGESLAPHQASTVAAAIEKSEEPEVKKDVEPEAKKDDEPEDKSATPSAPTQPTNDDVIMSDEIIIEIDD